jgi:hypothetical protein
MTETPAAETPRQEVLQKTRAPEPHTPIPERSDAAWQRRAANQRFKGRPLVDKNIKTILMQRKGGVMITLENEGVCVVCVSVCVCVCVRIGDFHRVDIAPLRIILPCDFPSAQSGDSLGLN